MGRGLGRWQRRFLKALKTLEDKHEDEGAGFYMWAVCKCVFQQSPELQEYKAHLEAESAEKMQRMKERAAAGDGDAKMFLAITASLRSCQKEKEGRPQVRHEFESMFDIVNPTRVVMTLASRGLVERKARPGYGVVSLTEAGRAEVRAAEQEVVSV